VKTLNHCGVCGYFITSPDSGESYEEAFLEHEGSESHLYLAVLRSIWREATTLKTPACS
jgi:hypothetical protein